MDPRSFSAILCFGRPFHLLHVDLG
jgi:hypothetical protein